MKKGLKKSLLVGRLALGLSSSFTLGVPNVFAQSAPAQSGASSFVFSSSDGVIIGTGELDGSSLDLGLLAGFSGFAQLMVTDAAGNTVAYDVMIASDGSITVVSDGGFGAMADLPALAGATVEVSYENEIDAAEGSDATGLERAREATAGNENAQKGLDQAEEAQSDARGKKGEKADEQVDDEQHADEQGAEQSGDEADQQGADEQDADKQGDEQDADEQGDDEADQQNEAGLGSADNGAGKSGDHGDNGGDDGDDGEEDDG